MVSTIQLHFPEFFWCGLWWWWCKLQQRQWSVGPEDCGGDLTRCYTGAKGSLFGMAHRAWGLRRWLVARFDGSRGAFDGDGSGLDKNKGLNGLELSGMMVWMPESDGGGGGWSNSEAERVVWCWNRSVWWLVRWLGSSGILWLTLPSKLVKWLKTNSCWTRTLTLWGKILSLIILYQSKMKEACSIAYYHFI